MARHFHSNSVIRNIWSILTGISALCFFLNACNGAGERSPTIGIVAATSYHTDLIQAFKTGMAKLNRVEGKNVTYIYNGLTGPSTEALDREIDKLLDQKVDMLFTTGYLPTARAKQVVAGTSVPVVFAGVVNPATVGLVESISHPGGDLTGVQVGVQSAKTLEWLLKIIPTTRKVVVPYNPDEHISVASLNALASDARKLNCELIPVKVYSIGEAVTAMEHVPPDTHAIFSLPSPTLVQEIGELGRAAANRNLPMVASHPVEEAALITLTTKNSDIGERSARLTNQILNGIKPSALPVEKAEIYLVINLKIAKAIGLEIPNIILGQADQVIR